MNEETEMTFRIRNTIGTITLGSGFFPVRVYIGKRAVDFVAACEIDGSIWFASAATGIDALLQLAERIADRTKANRDFESRMFEHLGRPIKSCGDSSCVYCGTWADHLRGEEMSNVTGV